MFIDAVVTAVQMFTAVAKVEWFKFLKELPGKSGKSEKPSPPPYEERPGPAGAQPGEWP